MTRLAERPIPTRAIAATLPRVDPIARLPVVVLYPHSRCNCRCRMCDIWRATGRTEITVEQVERWADEWTRLGVRRVALSGGEALMHSRIEELCSTIHASGVGITLMTTGLLLQRHAAWLPRYVDDVVVSLDGPESVHNAIRSVPRAFAKLAEGVAALRSAGPHVAISGRCVVQKGNYAHLRATVAAAREIGLDHISFLAADVSSDAFNRPGGWGAERTEEVALAPEDLAVLEREINLLEVENADEFASGFIVEAPRKLRARLLEYYGALCGVGDFPPVRCNAPWVSCVIESDGTVRPCFFQPAYGAMNDSDSLDGLLNSPQAVAFRRGLDVRTNPICRRCVCTLALEDE